MSDKSKTQIAKPGSNKISPGTKVSFISMDDVSQANSAKATRGKRGKRSAKVAKVGKKRAFRGAQKSKSPIGEDAPKKVSVDKVVSGTVSTKLPVLPFRLKDKDFALVCENFGQYANGTGPIGIANTWKVLELLGREHFHPDGRWLPKVHIGAGSCCGLKWRMTINTKTITWTSEDFKKSTLTLRYPSGKEGKVSLHSLLKREVLAEFQNLCFYAPIPGGDESGLGMVGILFDLRESKMWKLFTDVPGAVQGYFKAGSMHYTIDNDDIRVAGGEPSHVRNLIPVPSCLLEQMYPRVAGRIRDRKLLRELVRHSELVCRESPLVPRNVIGVVSMRLAFLSMIHNSRFEEAMYRHIVPGSLKLNGEVDKLWAGFQPTSFIDVGLQLVFAVSQYFLWRKILIEKRAYAARVGELFSKLLTLRRLLPTYLLSLVDRALSFMRKDRKTTTMGLVAGMSALLLWVRRRGQGVPTGDLSQYGKSVTAGLQVVVEEVSKRRPWYIGWLIPFVECANHGDKYPPTFLMHVICGLLPLKYGVLGHFMFNYLVSRQRASFPLTKGIEDDECVDEFILRNNEPIAGCNKVRLPHGYPNPGRLPCSGGKPWCHFVALSVEGVQVSVFRVCICNERAAVMSRVTAREDSPSKIWSLWFSKVRKVGHVTLPDLDEWLKHLPTRARGSLSNVATLSHALTKKELIQKAFVKREKRIKVVGSHKTKPNAAPRLIQGRSLGVKVATGPWTWSYSKKLKQVYHPRGLFLYAGGRSAEEVGSFYGEVPLRSDPLLVRANCCVSRLRSNLCVESLIIGAHWVAIDCKRWDSTVSSSAMKALQKDYQQCGAPLETIKAYEGRGGIRRGVTRYGIRYERTAQVSSGDGDTSGGNSRLHLVLLEACPYVLAAVVSGDDALIFTAHPELVCAQYVAGGLKPVPAPGIDFCSGLFYPTECGFVLGPKIGRVLAKTFMCMHKLPTSYLAWLRGVCMSLQKSTSFIPILRVIIPRFLELTCGRKVWIDRGYDYKIWADNSHDVVEDTWTFMWQRYNLGEAEILTLEDEIRGIQVGHVLKGDVWLSIVDRDA